MGAIPLMLNGVYGWNLDLNGVVEHGKKILKLERQFNAAAGLTAEDDRLPYFFTTKPLAPHNIVFQVSDKELDEVFAKM
jgi:aldehyde:ferredoxin oxidoreductase